MQLFLVRQSRDGSSLGIFALPLQVSVSLMILPPIRPSHGSVTVFKRAHDVNVKINLFVSKRFLGML